MAFARRKKSVRSHEYVNSGFMILILARERQLLRKINIGNVPINLYDLSVIRCLERVVYIRREIAGNLCKPSQQISISIT